MEKSVDEILDEWAALLKKDQGKFEISRTDIKTILDYFDDVDGFDDFLGGH